MKHCSLDLGLAVSTAPSHIGRYRRVCSAKWTILLDKHYLLQRLSNTVEGEQARQARVPVKWGVDGPIQRRHSPAERAVWEAVWPEGAQLVSALGAAAQVQCGSTLL